MKRSIISLIAIVAGVFLTGTSALGQAGVNVELLTAKGAHKESLKAFYQMPQRVRTPSLYLAAAKSSWALGLTREAKAFFEKTFSDPLSSKDQQVESMLSRGIIEFQDENFETSLRYTDRALTLLGDKEPLRARAYLLKGQALQEKKNCQEALPEFDNGLVIAIQSDISDLLFHKGLCLLQLAKLDEARTTFTKIPLSYERVGEVIRKLGEIAFEQKNYEEVVFWLEKGRREFKENFLDSWVDFALASASIDMKNGEKLSQISAVANKKFPPSDFWLTLLNQAAEHFYWSTSVEKRVES